MYSSILRRQSSTISPSLTFLRHMGGGPRTFPGGLNKWQWKRMHEKKAKEKEKRLLEQEKQLYQARIRSQIRAKLAPQQPGNRQPDPNYGPMSADDHIKALADRFMKAGAEDLWNESDGPIKSQPLMPVRRSVRSPIDVRKVVYESERIDSTDLSEFSNPKPRYYSDGGWSLNGSRCDFERNDREDKLGDGGLISRSIRTPVDLRNLTRLNGGLKSRFYSVYTRSSKGSMFKFKRNESSEEEDSDEEFGDGEEGVMKGRGNVGRLMSNAALRKYDTKKTRRVPLKFLEEEEDLSERVEAIKKEFKARNSVKNAVDKSDEDSILSDKRYLNCFTH